MFTDNDIQMILIVLGLTYISIHWTMDFVLLFRIKNKPELTDYGIDSTEQIKALLGISSILFIINWLLFVLPNGYDRTPNELFLTISFSTELQYIGLIFLTIAMIFADWARIARGFYAPSWGLNEKTSLITSGPYRWIRHPTYAYFIFSFIGFSLFTSFLPSLIYWLGIYGYWKQINKEEELLIHHFGEEYQQYQERTKKIIPFIL